MNNASLEKHSFSQTACEAVRIKEVERELGELNSETQHNDNLVSELRNRLGSVLSGGEPAKNQVGEIPQPKLCDLADYIRKERQRLHAANASLTEILATLEI